LSGTSPLVLDALRKRRARARRDLAFASALRFDEKTCAYAGAITRTTRATSSAV